MSRLALAIIVLSLSALLIFAAPPRHVNPEEVVLGRPDPRVLTSAYGLLAELLSAEVYRNTSRLVDLLLNITAAPDIAYTLRRFHEELKGINELLNQSRSLLEQAKKLAVAGRVGESMSLLNEVLRVLARANLTRADLELAAREVQRRLGAQTSPLVRAVFELISRHSMEAMSLGGLANMTETELTIEVEPRSAWVGSTVTVSGRLTSRGEPLSGRRVSIAVGGAIVGGVITDESGFFAYRLRLPHVYRRSLAIGAVYIPEADDAKFYRPSSNSTVLQLLYETPSLSVAVNPSVALPGDRVSIEIRADRLSLQVEVQFFYMTKLITLKDGSASFMAEVPAGASEGVYRVLAASRPNGTLGPASAAAAIVVRKLDLRLNVTAPRFAVTLLPARFTVCTEGWNGTLAGYRVKLVLAGAVAEMESQKPCVVVEAAVPPSTPTGWALAEIIVTPTSSRYRSVRTEVSTFIVNPLLLIPAAGLLAPLARSAKPSSRRERPSPSPLEQPREPEELEPYSLRLKSSDPVVTEYLAGVRIVEKATGVPLEPSHTISEYLQLVEPKLGEAGKVFAVLSGLAEARLYGGLPVSPEAARALREQLDELVGDTS